MADALSYQLKLVDQMSGPANQANKALASLQKQIKAEEQELARLNKAQRNLNKGDVVDLATSKALKQQINAKSNSLAALQQEMVNIGQAGAKDISGATAEVEGLGGALGALAGPAALAAAAIAGLGAVFTAAVIGGAALAIKAAEAKQDTLDLLNAMLGSQEAAEDVYDKIGDITRDVAISQERATQLARELTAAGITSKDALTDAIKSIGQVESVLGAEAGGKIQNILEKASQTGKFQINPKQLLGTGVQVQKLYEQIAADTHKSTKQVEAELKAGKISAEVGIAALTKVLDTKFAGPAAQQVLDFGNQIQRFKDNIGKLFEDVDTSGFLGALKEVLDLFDQDSATGKALHDTLTTIFDGVFSAGKVVLPYIKTALKGLVIISLQIAIAFKPLVKSLKEAFGGDQKSGVDSLATAMSAVGQAVGTVVGWIVKLSQNTAVIRVIESAALALAAAVGAISLAFGSLLAALAAPFALLSALAVVGAEFTDWAVHAGADIVTGLIQGLQNAGPALIQGLKDIGNDALAGFKKVFGIASPSKVMAQMGKHMMTGLEHGIDYNAPAANDTLAESVSPAPAVRGGVGSGTTVTHNAGGVTINITINGVGSVDELKEVMPSIMADALEQAGLTIGAPQAA